MCNTQYCTIIPIDEITVMVGYTRPCLNTIAPNVSNKPDITHGEIVGTSAGLYVTILIPNDEINAMVCYTLTHHNEKKIVIVCYTYDQELL